MNISEAVRRVISQSDLNTGGEAGIVRQVRHVRVIKVKGGETDEKDRTNHRQQTQRTDSNNHRSVTHTAEDVC